MGKDGIITWRDHCKTHMQAMIPGKNKESGTSVANRLDATRAKLITKSRHYLKTILEVLLLCSQQEIAIRERVESIKSLNRGNFRDILELGDIHDEMVKEILTCGPRNAIYTSPIIQKELLHILGEMVQSTICCEIREATLATQCMLNQVGAFNCIHNVLCEALCIKTRSFNKSQEMFMNGCFFMINASQNKCYLFLFWFYQPISKTIRNEGYTRYRLNAIGEILQIPSFSYFLTKCFQLPKACQMCCKVQLWNLLKQLIWYQELLKHLQIFELILTGTASLLI